MAVTDVQTLIESVEVAGGRFKIDGDRLGIFPKAAATPLLEELGQHKRAIIELLREREMNASDSLYPLRPLFITWYDARVRFDAEAIALRTSARWSTTVNALHCDYCIWMSDHDHVPSTRAEFLCLLQELGSTIRVISGEQYVDHVGLKEDVKAHALFGEPVPIHLPATPAAAAQMKPEVYYPTKRRNKK